MCVISRKIFCVTAFSKYYCSRSRVGIFILHGHLIQNCTSCDGGAVCWMRCPGPLSLSFVVKLGRTVFFHLRGWRGWCSGWAGLVSSSPCGPLLQVRRGRDRQWEGCEIWWVRQQSCKSMGGWGWAFLEHGILLKFIIVLFCFLDSETVPLKWCCFFPNVFQQVFLLEVGKTRFWIQLNARQLKGLSVF